jgi:tripartite ATP-independent transporter DctM subunit
MNVAVGLGGVVILVLLLVARVPVALALIAVAFGGITFLIGPAPAFGIVMNTPYSFVASWTLSAVPMFLLMGFVAYHSGLTTGLFGAAKVFLRKIPGGLAISAIFACSGFAAVSGSSLACAAAMGRIAIPEMVSAGYRPSIACGSVAAGGTIGALIPPSILMIIYGIIAETSVTQVFVGGISIGLLTAFSYVAVILLISWLKPNLIPRHVADEEEGSLRTLIDIWPTLALIVLVFGGLFSGFFSATEAGAVGALGAIVLGLITRGLTRKAMEQSLLETVLTTSSLFIIAVGAAMFTRFLGISGLSGLIHSAVAGADLNYAELMLVIVLVYLILGTFMEPFGAMLVTLPVFLPILKAEGISLVWFGVVVVKMLEIGMITPPFGLNVFVIRNVAARYASTVQIFRGVVPFFLADLVVVFLAIAFPQLVLVLVGR